MDLTEPDEHAWCADRRQQVNEYLLRQPQEFGAVGETPAWLVAGVVSIWAIESLKAPGSVGWWAICGDVPTDYCSSGDVPTPRAAALHFGREWATAIEATNPDDATIGETGFSASLLSLLDARARLLIEFAADDALWDG